MLLPRGSEGIIGILAICVRAIPTYFINEREKLANQVMQRKVTRKSFAKC